MVCRASRLILNIGGTLEIVAQKKKSGALVARPLFGCESAVRI
jgi:hypothetical protein